MSDSRLATLRAANLADIDRAQKRYQQISTTIDDAVARLQKIVDTSDEGQRGEWVEPIRDDARSVKDSLSKAAVRYRDVATEIAKYQPELKHAIDEVDAAERDAADADASLARANALPDAQPGPDGALPPEEQHKADVKRRAQGDATADIAAATKRLTGALDALDVAGKRFGDAVNCKNYDDGLTDKISWRVMAVFKQISKWLGVVAMVLTALAFLIPGLNVLAILGAAATAVVLISDSVLLAGGDGSVLAVVLGALSLGMAGLGAAFGALGTRISTGIKFMKDLPKFRITMGFNQQGQAIPLLTLGGPLRIGGAAAPGFFDPARWTRFLNSGFFKHLPRAWVDRFFTTEFFRNLTFLGSLGGAFAAGANGFKWIFSGWGALSQVFNLGAGLIIAGMQATEHHALEDA